MHIKQISIAGFKSYCQKTIIEQLDKGHNVVVGRNGSGKSNFFAAIEFVLSNEYTNLRLEQRKNLICQMKSSEPSSAFVEIVFDTADLHKPLEKNEISIRRTISQYKDQYALDGKVISRKEVVQFLEMIGLYSSNPYHIVKQGKITHLTTARPPQLLQVLYEVSGIRIYDNQKESAMITLKKAKEEMTSALEARDKLAVFVDTLRQEVSEQERYEKLDKKRRVLEFVMLDKEKTEITNKLQSLDQMFDHQKEKQRLLTKQKTETRHQMAIVQKGLKQFQGVFLKAKEQKSLLSKQHVPLVKIKTSIELKVQDLEKELTVGKQLKSKFKEQLRELSQKIEEKEAQLQEVSKRCVELDKQEEVLNEELREKDQQRSKLLDKQRRGTQFASSVERNQWLNQELATILRLIQSNINHTKQMEKELSKRKQRLTQEQEYITSHDKECQTMSKKIDQYTLRVSKLESKRHRVKLDQQNLYNMEDNLQQQINQHKEDVLECKQSIKKQLNVGIVIGGESVRKVIEAFRSLGADKNYVVDGYYGQVIDNFQCDKAIYHAVEVVAGNKLLHHIVESDAIAQEILKVCDDQHLPGTFLFMPLNRLQKHTHKYPEDKNAVPLIFLLKYHEKCELAIQKVFGGTLLCKDLKSMPVSDLPDGLSCVTYDGDQIGKGVLRGGYHAPKKSILNLHRHLKCSNEVIHAKEAELQAVQEDIKQTRVNICDYDTELSKTNEKLERLKRAYEWERNRKRLLPEEMRMLREKIKVSERKKQVYEHELELMKRKERSLCSEFDQDLTDTLTAEEQSAFEQLDTEIRQLRQQQQEAFNSALEANKNRFKLENLLNANLLPRREELSRLLKSSNHVGRASELDGYRKQIETTVDKIETLHKEMAELDRKIATIAQQRDNAQKKLNELLSNLKKIEEEMNINSTDLQSQDTRRETLEKQEEECLRKIDELEALPAINKVYFTLPQHKLFSELEKTRKELKKVSNCNKKAQDDYNKEFKNLNEANKRIDELKTVEETIHESFNKLERRREECIQKTYQQVNANFRAIFRRFVPSGEGRLILHTKDTSKHGTNEVSYTGLGLEVSFVGGNAIMNEMNQLSGGQKTLVAITLILAIQQYKPAPFYLLDEIDQALDSDYRDSVADVIHERSNYSQFITTTFRRELLKHANKFYGVRCRNKVSHIDVITQKQAYDFVTDDKVNE